MNILSIVLLILILVSLFAAIRYAWRHRNSCGKNCRNCNACEYKKDSEKKN